MPTVDLKDLRIYQLAMRVGEDVWALVDGWSWFNKQALGLQWVRAADSIAANISEGYGRYSFKENARFSYYARGSLRETETWLTKANARGLVPAPHAQELPEKLDSLRRSLDNDIHSLGKDKPAVVNESASSDSCQTRELPPLEDFLAERAA